MLGAGWRRCSGPAGRRSWSGPGDLGLDLRRRAFCPAWYSSSVRPIARKPPHLGGDRGSAVCQSRSRSRGDAGTSGGLEQSRRDRSRPRRTADWRGWRAPRRLARVFCQSAASKSGWGGDAFLQIGVLVGVAAERSVGGARSGPDQAAVGRLGSIWPRSGFFRRRVSLCQEPNAAMIRAFSSSRGRSPTATTIEVSGRYQRW